MKDNFANSLQLTRFYLRRERSISTMWILILLVVVVGLVPGMYGAVGGEGFEELLHMLELPAMIAMVGPAYALASQTYGALYSNMMLLFTALTVGIMNIFLVIRHTRADEEQGRYEVVRSLPTGRLANLNATFLTATLVNVALSVLVGLGMFALGTDDMGFGASMLFGASLGAVGLVFAAFAALFAQLSSNARGATSFSFAALILFYFLRAPGDMNADISAGLDVGEEITALLSPLGLVLRAQPYVGDYWWPIGILLGIAVVVALIAFRLNVVRDIDQGIIPARAGVADAARSLCSPLGLIFRLNRTAILLSLFGMFALGASYATILGGIDEFIATNEFYQSLLLGPANIEFMVAAGASTEEIVEALRTIVAAAGFTLTELFASMVNNIMALFGLVAVLLFVLRAKAEEKAIRTELVLATATSRVKYLGGYVAISFAVAVLIQLLLAVGLYAVGRTVLDDPGELSFRFLLEAALVYVPAMWAMSGLTVLLIGVLPKAVGAIWAYFGYSFLVVFIGRLDIFPAWLQYTTPFGFVPQLPVDETNFLTLALLTVFAATVTVLGFLGYRRRDINAVTH